MNHAVQMCEHHMGGLLTMWVIFGTVVGLLVFNLSDKCLGSPGEDSTGGDVSEISGRMLYRSPGKVLAIASSPDGKTLAVTEAGNPGVRLIDISSGREDGMLVGTLPEPRGLTFMKKGELLAVACPGGVHIWDMRSRTLSHTMKYKANFARSVTAAYSGRYLFSATDVPDPVVRRLDLTDWSTKVLFNVATTNVLPSTFGFEVNSLSVSPDEATLGINLLSGTIICDLKTNAPSRAIRNDEPADAVIAFSPDGKLLAIGREIVDLWDVKAGTRVGVCHAEFVLGIAFSPDKTMLVSVGEGIAGRPGRIDVWNVRNGKHIGMAIAHTDVVFGLAFVPGLHQVVTGSFDGTLFIWDLKELAAKSENWEQVNRDGLAPSEPNP